MPTPIRPGRKSVNVTRPEKGSTPARPSRPAPRPKPTDMSKVKLRLEYVDINDIQPYEWNARDNAKAVTAVANSIRAFGFVVPVVIDANGVLGAGHTRVEAAKTLGMLEVPAVRAEHLTKEQMDAFRIADNKVAEMATWNTSMLADEMDKLTGLFDFTDFGFGQGEIDCLASLVGDDCLSTANLGALTGTAAGEETPGRSVRRAPLQARIVIGELTFFVPAEQYRNWVQGLRDLHDFKDEDIAADLKRRLGFHE